jgi:hypothetical protein
LSDSKKVTLLPVSSASARVVALVWVVEGTGGVSTASDAETLRALANLDPRSVVIANSTGYVKGSDGTLVDGLPDEASSTWGRITTKIVELVGKELGPPEARGPVVLVLDGLGTHCRAHELAEFKDGGIDVLRIGANTSQVLQFGDTGFVNGALAKMIAQQTRMLFKAGYESVTTVQWIQTIEPHAVSILANKSTIRRALSTVGFHLLDQDNITVSEESVSKALDQLIAQGKTHVTQDEEQAKKRRHASTTYALTKLQDEGLIDPKTRFDVTPEVLRAAETSLESFLESKLPKTSSKKRHHRKAKGTKDKDKPGCIVLTDPTRLERVLRDDEVAAGKEQDKQDRKKLKVAETTRRAELFKKVRECFDEDVSTWEKKLTKYYQGEYSFDDAVNYVKAKLAGKRFARPRSKKPTPTSVSAVARED